MILLLGSLDLTPGPFPMGEWDSVLRYNQSMKFDPQKPVDVAQDKYHRRSIRLQGYDYSQAGAYYVTIVTQLRQCFFGGVIHGEMRSNAGRKNDTGGLGIHATEISDH